MSKEQSPQQTNDHIQPQTQAAWATRKQAVDGCMSVCFFLINRFSSFIYLVLCWLWLTGKWWQALRAEQKFMGEMPTTEKNLYVHIF